MTAAFAARDERVTQSWTTKRESSSILKKRTKKLLRLGVRVAATRTPKYQSFLVLFFEKEHSCFLASFPSPARYTAASPP
jgi:hypothetical protein